ncbi:MAG: metallophosphoesterase [Telluria sp.]
MSAVEMTEHGVHKRVLLPLGPLGSAGIPTYAGTGDSPMLPGFLDGPVVRQGNGGWSATWFCQDRVQRRDGSGDNLAIDCGGRRHTFALGAPVAAPDVVPMPAKLAVLSDIEGNLAYLDGALASLGIVDANGKWNYGANRLVIVGDSVDRGRDVFAVLWRLHGLSQQAAAAGGGVHVLLGNHEQYVLRGNPSRAHPEHRYTVEAMGGKAEVFGADTVIGQWLRTQPVVLQAGRVLFAHGGISAQVAQQKLSVARLNGAMRAYWRGERAPSPALDAVLGQGGVTQYRGYLMAVPDTYEKATQADVDATLEAYGADAIVVGHTLVDKVTPLYNQRVYAVDVNTNEAAQEALVFDNGVATVVPVRIGRMLPAEQAKRKSRPLSLLDDGDRSVIGKMISHSRALSQLPHPY